MSEDKIWSRDVLFCNDDIAHAVPLIQTYFQDLLEILFIWEALFLNSFHLLTFLARNKPPQAMAWNCVRHRSGKCYNSRISNILKCWEWNEWSCCRYTIGSTGQNASCIVRPSSTMVLTKFILGVMTHILQNQIAHSFSLSKNATILLLM